MKSIRWLFFIAMAALAGCSTATNKPGFFSGPQPLRSSVMFNVSLVDSIPKSYSGQVGRAICTPDGAFCTLEILRSHYPICLTHEIRHAFEGYFHDNRPNGDSCHEY